MIFCRYIIIRKHNHSKTITQKPLVFDECCLILLTSHDASSRNSTILIKQKQYFLWFFSNLAVVLPIEIWYKDTAVCRRFLTSSLSTYQLVALQDMFDRVLLVHFIHIQSWMLSHSLEVPRFEVEVPNSAYVYCNVADFDMFIYLR